MRKLLILSALVTLIAVPATALDFAAKQFYIQGVVAMPIGDWSDFATLGYGGGLGILVPHTDALGFRAEAGYLLYSTDKIGTTEWDFSQIPIFVLVQYNLADQPIYFVGGVGLVMSQVSVKTTIAGVTYTADDNGSDFGAVVGVGFEATPQLFFEGRFQMVSDANEITGHIGYKF